MEKMLLNRRCEKRPGYIYPASGNSACICLMAIRVGRVEEMLYVTVVGEYVGWAIGEIGRRKR